MRIPQRIGDKFGFEISVAGIHAPPEKMKSVLDWHRLQFLHDVGSSLGLASYYRKFIPGFHR